MKAVYEIVELNDVITTSTGACRYVGQVVDECDPDME